MSLADWIEAETNEFKRVDPTLKVWEMCLSSVLSPSRRAREGTKRTELLSRATREFQPLVLKYSEDPVSDGLSGDWKHIGGEFWQVPAEVNVEELHDWLFLGSWSLLHCEKLPDLEALNSLGFSPSANELTEFGRRNQITFHLVAFHDNDPWIVYLA